MMTTELVLRRVCVALTSFNYRFADEYQLQAGIAIALDAHGIVYTREYEPSTKHRFDFWCPTSRIVIEVKVDGSLPAAMRQIAEYMQYEQCQAVVIAATKQWASTPRDRFDIAGKPVRVVRLQQQAF